MRNLRKNDNPSEASYFIAKSYCAIGNDYETCDKRDFLVTYTGHELKHCGLCEHHVQDLDRAGLIRVGTNENRETIMLMVNYNTGHIEEVPISEVRCCTKENISKVQWNDYLDDVSFRMFAEETSGDLLDDDDLPEPEIDDNQLTLLDCLPAEEKIKMIPEEELKERFLENF